MKKQFSMQGSENATPIKISNSNLREAPSVAASHRTQVTESGNTSTNPVPSQPIQAHQPAKEFDFFGDEGTVSSNTSTAISASRNVVSSTVDIDEGAPQPVVLNRQELQEKREEEIQERVDAALQQKKEVLVICLKIVTFYSSVI